MWTCFPFALTPRSTSPRLISWPDLASNGQQGRSKTQLPLLSPQLGSSSRWEHGKDLALFHFGNELGLELLQQGQIIHCTYAIIVLFFFCFHQVLVTLYNETQNRCFDKWGKLRHFGVKSSL